MSTPSSFWSRSYTVIRRRIRLNFYFGEVKLSEFNQLAEEAKAELAKLGLAPLPETMFLTSNRAGMHICCWYPLGDDATADALTAKLEAAKWKMTSD